MKVIILISYFFLLRIKGIPAEIQKRFTCFKGLSVNF